MPNIPIVPDLETSRTQSFFTMDQIWFGPDQSGRIVPRVKNIILQTTADGAKLWEVSSVDPVSHISSLKPANLISNNSTADSTIIGGGIGSSYSKLRIWINTDRIPFTMNFDARFETANSAATYLKVFRGVDITDSGAIISAMYDSSGNKTSDRITLTLISQPTTLNLARKAPVSAWSSDNIAMYETLTVVYYTADGEPCGTDTGIALRGNLIASSDRSKPSVHSVELVSSFLSVSDRRLLEYPVGMTVTSDSMMARVVRDNGDIVELPIDGNKVSLLGIDDLIASESGRTAPLLLSYRLDSDELAEGATLPLPDRYLSTEYRARAVTTDSDVTYNVKLFVVPQWVAGASARWRLRYFLYSLERMDVYEVTDYITLGANSPVFNGTAYGVAQNMTVVVNLAEVSNRWRYHRHPQQFTIALNTAGSSNVATSFWNIKYASDINYGQGRKAGFLNDPDNPGKRRIRIDNGFTILSEWLNNMYRSLLPLYNTSAETTAPNPTHVRIRIGDTWQREIPISDILNPINNIDAVITQGMDVRLEYIRRTDNSVFELAMGSLTASAI